MPGSFDTANNIVNDVAVELGLVAFNSTSSDVFASTDPNIGQLCQLLKSVGRGLVREAAWSQLRQTYTFSTSSGTARYALPADFDRVLDQTAWNRTNRLPLGGPMSPQLQEFLRARLVGVSWNILWTTLQGKFHAFPDEGNTPDAYVIAYQYVSGFWCKTATQDGYGSEPWLPNTTYSTSAYVVAGGRAYQATVGGTTSTTGPGPTHTSGTATDGTVTWTYVAASGQDTTTAKTDVIYLDKQLVTRALKLAWLSEKKLDTTSALADYERALFQAKAADTQAPVLSFTQHSFAEPLLGPWNLPTNGTAGQ